MIARAMTDAEGPEAVLVLLLTGRARWAEAVMAAYNSVNGTTMTESPLLRQILHREWGFDGVTMTDWYAGRTTAATAKAGLDLVMPGLAALGRRTGCCRAGRLGQRGRDRRQGSAYPPAGRTRGSLGRRSSGQAHGRRLARTTDTAGAEIRCRGHLRAGSQRGHPGQHRRRTSAATCPALPDQPGGGRAQRRSTAAPWATAAPYVFPTYTVSPCSGSGLHWNLA